MKFQATPVFLDVAAYIKAGQAPSYVFKKASPGEAWLVPSGPLTADDTIWLSAEDQHVLVAAHRYRVAAEPEALLGFGMQLAAEAMARVPRGTNVLRCMLVLGRPAEDLRPGDDRFAVWAGLALHVQQTAR